MRKPGSINEWVQLPGWCHPCEGDHLAFVASTLKEGSRAIEIGTYMGKSAVALGIGCKESGSVLYSIDHYRGNREHKTRPSMPIAQQNIQRFGLDGSVILVFGESESIAAAASFDVSLLYIDGEHGYAHVIHDFVCWWPHLVSGCDVLFHDYKNAWPDVKRAVDYVAEEYGLQFCTTPNSGSIGHFKKGIR